LTSCSQSTQKNKVDKQDCAELLSKKVSSNTDSVAVDLYNLSLCSSVIDSFDLEYMGPFLIEITLKNAKVKSDYKNLIKDFEEFKTTKSYTATKEEFYPQYVFKKSIATKNSWPSDSLKLIQMDVPSDFIEGYGEFIKEFYSHRKTHGFLLEEYRNGLKE
jgi:hypothetical protein